MNKHYSNKYILIYSFTLILFLTTFLALLVNFLKPIYEYNKKIEKYQNILFSVGIRVPKDSVEEYFLKYVKKSYVINYLGDTIPDINAFNVNVGEEVKKDIKDRLLPIFEAEIDGKQKYIIPLYGKGLWGPIWGYISIDEDRNTVYGCYFDHKSETPGLGAEINKQYFQEKFIGKKIFDFNNYFIGIKVVKGNIINTDHEVDGIAGSTMTCIGLSQMLENCLIAYKNFFQKK